ncbi:MAG: type II toxin-antitoxin system RelE/ParE family toxin [Clostridia bacterium]|nr:type II toxin-antitoxin system RelE/ParE family toxin [Clostridia bacterium]
MKYKVIFSNEAKKQLKKLDRHIATLIIIWIRKNLENCEDPRQYGKALTANRSGQWRYRIGDYRLICEIQDKEITILVLEVGHRKNIYE